MTIVKLPIDTKSLHYNIRNDNKIGHTATVATPLKQGKSFKEDLGQIYTIPKTINFDHLPNLIREFVKNTKAKIKITHVFVFDKLSVNGISIKNKSQFCIYVREEVDDTKTHYGRIKVHYPLTLRYEDQDLSINNKEIIKLVSEALHNYAFLIDAFEYNTKTETLNFKATIVGENFIPYSKVFINEKGVGNKFVGVFSDIADIYDCEIISMRKKIDENIDPSNFQEYLEKNKNIAMKIATSYLKERGAKSIRNLNNEYPYSLFDLEYLENGSVKYAIICFTSTKSKYFNLSLKRVNFLNYFCDQTSIILITNINDEYKIKIYSCEEANELSKNINSVMYIDGE